MLLLNYLTVEVPTCVNITGSNETRTPQADFACSVSANSYILHNIGRLNNHHLYNNTLLTFKYSQ